MNTMKKRILITFGPTDESIDDVMKITNMSTGSLGMAIANELVLAKVAIPEDLWLVCNRNTYRLNKKEIESLTQDGAHFIQIGGVKQDERVVSETADLLAVMTELLTENQFEYVIHSAAVGDYTVRYVTSAAMLFREIMSLNLERNWIHRESLIKDAFQNPQNVIGRETKMSSDETDMILGLQLTPKVVGHIKPLIQEKGTKLISWKLLSGVSEFDLYTTALEHGRRNGSSLVIANDLSEIGGGRHQAMIIDTATKEMQHAGTKEDIAKKIADYIKSE